MRHVALNRQNRGIPAETGKRQNRWITAFLAIVSLTMWSTGSLAGSGEFHPMHFDQISLEDGLSQSNVLGIHQDATGLMWFATENGLNRYNGYEIQHFKRERGNPDALSSDFIFDIDEDADGNLWLATNGGGLSMFDTDSGKFTNYRNDPANDSSIPGNIVRRLLIDDQGMIWVGTRNNGLARLNPATSEFTRYDLGFDGGIYALTLDSAGFLWIGGDHGITRLDRDTGDHSTLSHDASEPGSLGAGTVRAVYEDSHRTLWVGTYGDGLHRLGSDGKTFAHFRRGAAESTLSDNRVSVIFEDADRRIWIGTANGLNLLDREDNSFARFTRDNGTLSSLGDNDVSSIYQDRGGMLWVGTKNRGVSKWNPRTWSYGLEPAKEITASGESRPNVTSFVESADGRLWLGTFGDGVSALDRETGEITKYRQDAVSQRRIGDNRVMSLMRDSKDRIWIGTMTAGVNRINTVTGVIETFRHDPADATSLGANGVMAMFEDSRGRIWVGTFGGGISLFDASSQAFTNFVPEEGNPNSLSSRRVTSFAEDASGMLWIGTEGGGLNLLDPDKGVFHRFAHDPEDPATLADNTVFSLSADSGNVWIGTSGGGLDRVVGNASDPAGISFTNVSQVDGLSNDVIYGIEVDAAGWLWLSTNYGITRFDPNTGQTRILHRRDGLQSEEFNFGAHYRSESGEMFFGGHNGYNAFDPGKIQVNAVAPAVLLTGFFNLNDPVKSGIPEDEANGIDVTYKDEGIAFEFAALDYAAPEQNRYMYKLEGFDSEWIDLGTRRRVTYTNLDAGHYLLRVRAANSDGIWNEVGYSIPVNVAPAPWNTWWAYLAYFAVAANIVFALWLMHHHKVRREEEYSRRLEREVASRTDRILENNKQLHALNKALQESSLSDPLTGLRNRRFVFEEVPRDLEVIRRKAQDERLGVDSTSESDLVFMMIDLDNFKPINDTYGHAAGDQMLLEVRDVLLNTCRRSDFVVRWGGDEFVIIAKQAKPGEAEELAERIRSEIASHAFDLADGQIVRTTCSIGFAAYPLFRGQAEEADLDQIINLADGLMYEAKKQRNAWAGMLTPTVAATSFEVEEGELQPTSLLFRAKRAGKLVNHGREEFEESVAIHLRRANSGVH